MGGEGGPRSDIVPWEQSFYGENRFGSFHDCVVDRNLWKLGELALEIRGVGTAFWKLFDKTGEGRLLSACFGEEGRGFPNKDSCIPGILAGLQEGLRFRQGWLFYKATNAQEGAALDLRQGLSTQVKISEARGGVGGFDTQGDKRWGAVCGTGSGG